jgi:hypothetical protein
MASSTIGLAARYFFGDSIGGVLRFPLWWYTRGLAFAAARASASVVHASRSLALGVWVRNLFVPMYGETGTEGRAISFFVRLAMVGLRGFAVAVWAALVWTLFGVYVLAPAAAVTGMLFHLAGAIAV